MRPSSGLLSERIQAERRRRFVGRVTERERFAEMLDGLSDAVVLWIHGPGGVGKTTLLGELAADARARGRQTSLIDVRELDPRPPAFFEALARGLGLPGTEGLPEALTAEPPVILLDTYEAIGALDGWLRTDLVPSLPTGTLVVVAGRIPPGEWRLDPGLSGLVTGVALQNLSLAEGEELLARRGVAAALRAAVSSATHGHPLALALVAELPQAVLRPDFSLADAPDVIATLVDRLVRTAPGPLHRDALFLCAEALVTTEGHLAAVFGDEAPRLFDWLRGLSFVETGTHGLFPHDLAREVLSAELRQRGPDALRPLHRSVRDLVLARLSTVTDPRARTRAALELLYLHRHNPAFSWVVTPGYGTVDGEPFLPDARETVLELVGAPEARAIVGRWLDSAPDAVTLYRNLEGELQGLAGAFEVDAAGLARAAEFDPAARVAAEHVGGHGGLREGERVLFCWLFSHRVFGAAALPSRTEFQARCVARFLSTPPLAWSFLPLRAGSRREGSAGWRGVLEYGDHQLVPGSTFTVDGTPQHLLAHDWRRVPPSRWLELMEERELGAPPTPAGAPGSDGLSDPELRAAVRTALKALHRDDVLRESPLTRSRLVRGRGGDPLPVIRQLLREAADSLQGHPRDEKLFRALEVTYLDPEETQEAAAETLDLPFSTYRRHLGAAIERVAAWFAEREARS